MKTVYVNVALLSGYLVLLVSTAVAADADLTRGERLYKVCAGCHGFAGEGNELVNAPGLAGLESWYLARQIDNYRAGIRGGSEDDAAGQAMAAMIGSLQSEDEVRDVVAYIDTLPKYAIAKTPPGDAGKGQAHYAPCIACHGDKGQGNPALQAPGLASLHPWYQILQLAKYRDGRRGTHPEDTYGQQMAPMAKVLADDPAVLQDVAAYIATLGD